MHKQRGLSLIGILFWIIILVFVAILGFRLVPAYTEYFSVVKVLKEIGQDPNLNSMSNGDIRDKFSKFANVDYITSVKPSDLDISHSNGQTVVSAQYEYRTKLVGNVSLVIDFSASSNGQPVARQASSNADSGD